MTAGRPRWITVAHGIMAGAFLFSAVVQYNDPDPIPWMALYGAASAMAACAAWRPERCPRSVPLAIGAIALVGSLATLAAIDGPVRLADLVAAWEMKSTRVELAREAGGLAIVAGWMVVAAWTSPAARPTGSAQS